MHGAPLANFIIFVATKCDTRWTSIWISVVYPPLEWD